MDNIDKKILHLLQENARYPLKHLASKVFLSSPAVSARIERLEKSGIISGYHASVAPVSLGYHITAFKHGARSKTETGILPVYPSMSERFGV